MNSIHPRHTGNARRICALAGPGLVALVLGLNAPAALAELRKVDQTVYGMDCAPCAYGVEKSIRALDGVESARVSLNDGNVVVKFARNNEISIADIHRVVSDGGFTPREARVEIGGKLVREGGDLQLMTEDGRRYRLIKAADADTVWTELQDQQVGVQLVLKGVVRAEDTTQFEVEQVSAT